VVAVGEVEGSTDHSVISCDTLMILPITLLEGEPVGPLSLGGRIMLDHALRSALDVQY
jgi:hypothetical protein